MRSEVGGEAMRAEPEQGPASRPARSRRRTLLAVAAGALLTLAGFAVYLRLASTRARHCRPGPCCTGTR
jgi:ferric-dicitrate binding protein FerR (iron transport regulator)